MSQLWLRHLWDWMVLSWREGAVLRWKALSTPTGARSLPPSLRSICDSHLEVTLFRYEAADRSERKDLDLPGGCSPGALIHVLAVAGKSDL